jgi:hypothetical protein
LKKSKAFLSRFLKFIRAGRDWYLHLPGEVVGWLYQGASINKLKNVVK